jgi:hypothetical protein
MTILDGAPGPQSDADNNAEADTIVASAVLGLFASECLREHDIIIGYGEDADREAHVAVKAKLDKALRGYGVGSHIKVLKTPGWTDYSKGGGSSTRAITASSGPGGQRDIEMSSEALKFARELQANTQSEELGGTPLMDERGAYYGIVDFPGQVRLISTTRRLIKYSGEGGRWKRDVDAHGMIKAQMDNFRSPNARPWSFGSMGALDTPFERKLSRGEFPRNGEGVVGYCHGMNWAIMHTALLGGGTAYEVAVGSGTTKLASCFGCTTFMYANGAPPSYMHFGRAESWVPTPTNETDNPDYKDRSTGKIDALVSNWAGAVAGFLENGASILKACGAEGYRSLASKLETTLARRQESLKKANLFLDALTVHESDLKRLSRALSG